jgi:hypothetical protein
MPMPKGEPGAYNVIETHPFVDSPTTRFDFESAHSCLPCIDYAFDPHAEHR